jgi:signal transduction histidine kinase
MGMLRGVSRLTCGERMPPNGHVLTRSTPAPMAGRAARVVAASAAATATAMLVGPVRARLRAAGAGRVLGAAPPVPLEEMLVQVARSLRRMLALDSAEVWTASSGILERAASDPDLGSCSIVLSYEEEQIIARAGVRDGAWATTWLPELAGDGRAVALRVAPATHYGELRGLIVVVRPHNARFSDADETLMQALARKLGRVLHNVRVGSALQASLDELHRQADELRASRARVVAAADAERRRIERDLHDGAQQQLYALALNVRLARELSESDPPQARAVLDQVSHDVEQAFESFRDLARGIYPSVLVDRGLPEGLRAAASRAHMPTRLDVRVSGRYPPEVESTVYFCCLEALQNAARHAGSGAEATVRVWEGGGRLHFEVADDGIGFDPAAGSTGAGLVNLNDRLGALGGRPLLTTAPGHGTRVGGWVPL